MLIDLTQTTLQDKVYRGGSPALKVEEITCKTGNATEYKTLQMTCASHNMGTHIDIISPDNVIEPERMIAPGIKYDVRHLGSGPIEVKDIDLSVIKGGEYVFFQTGWDAYITDHERYDMHPEISLDLVKELAKRNVNMIGIDALGLGRNRNHGIIDVYLGKEKKYAIENLTNLDQVPMTGFKVYALPIKVEGLDVAPVRILAEVE